MKNTILILMMIAFLSGCSLFQRQPEPEPPPDTVEIPVSIECPGLKRITVPALPIEKIEDRHNREQIARAYVLSIEVLKARLLEAITVIDSCMDELEEKI